MDLSAADLAGICTRASITNGKHFTPSGTPCSRLHARVARLYH